MVKQILSHVEMESELSTRLHNDVAEVEDLLHKELSKGPDFLTEKSRYLLAAGGKRFRPVFTLLCGYIHESAPNADLITAAAVVELIHLATLYHDDVMDEATVRRGVTSANMRWSNSVAILAGDNLFARSSFLLSTLGSKSASFISDVVSMLVTGQLRETLGTPADNKVEHYLRVIEEKTACLIAAGGELAGYTTGSDAGRTTLMNQLGHNVGMAFQISDDIIDISSNSAQSGKTPGTDIREGVFTLPVLYALEETSPEGQELRELLVGPVTDDAQVQHILQLIERTNGITRAKKVVHEYKEKADALIEQLPASSVQDALFQLVNSTVVRLG